MIEAIPASNDVNLPGLATTETLTRHVNLNYFSEAVSWEGEERLADADSWRITGNSDVMRLRKGCRQSGSHLAWCRRSRCQVRPLLRVAPLPGISPAFFRLL